MCFWCFGLSGIHWQHPGAWGGGCSCCSFGQPQSSGRETLSMGLWWNYGWSCYHRWSEAAGPMSRIHGCSGLPGRLWHSAPVQLFDVITMWERLGGNSRQQAHTAAFVFQDPWAALSPSWAYWELQAYLLKNVSVQGLESYGLVKEGLFIP